LAKELGKKKTPSLFFKIDEQGRVKIISVLKYVHLGAFSDLLVERFRDL
jgi:hypothetical protein